MNTRSNRNPAISIALVIVFVMACNAIGTPPEEPPPLPLFSTPTAEILHFENEFVAFDYPGGMRLFNSGDPAFLTYPIESRLGGELVVGLADPHWIKNGLLFSSIGVYRHPIPPDSDLETIIQRTYEQKAFQTEVLESSAPVTFADLPAYQRIYRIASGPLWYTFRDTWIEKEGQIVRLSIWEEVYGGIQPSADMISVSLVIKDNLPPLVEMPTPEPTASPTLFPASMILHYEDDAVAFDYLKEMKVYAANDPAFQVYPDFELGDDLVVGLGDPRFTGFDKYYRSIRILRQQIPAGSNLEAIMLDTYREAEKKFPQENGILNANGLITFNGFTAIQRTHRVYSGEPAYELRDFWTQKDNEIFIIAIWTEYTNPDDFAVFEAGADLLLQSLRIK